MNQEEKLQRLLRLKRHEKPAEDYFEDFLAEFHRRRRSAATDKSPGLFGRMKTGLASAMEMLRRPAVGWGAVTACGVVLMVLSQRPLSSPAPAPSGGGAPAMTASSRDNPAVPSSQALPASETRVVNDAVPFPSSPPPGKPRTKDQPRDVKNLIGPAVPPPAEGE